MITVKDWMSKPVRFIHKDKSVFEACKLMNEHNIGSLVVSEDGKKMEGIITERDLLKKVLAAYVDTKKTLVKDVMTKKVVAVPTTVSLLEISKIMTKNFVRRVIVEEDGVVVGVVTSRDLLQLMAG